MADLLFFSMTVAMKAQPRWEVMDRVDVFYAGTALLVAGTVLVVSSFLALGFTGTFLGTWQTSCCRQSLTDFSCRASLLLMTFSCVEFVFRVCVCVCTQGETTSHLFPFGTDGFRFKNPFIFQCNNVDSISACLISPHGWGGAVPWCTLNKHMSVQHRRCEAVSHSCLLSQRVCLNPAWEMKAPSYRVASKCVPVPPRWRSSCLALIWGLGL